MLRVLCAISKLKSILNLCGGDEVRGSLVWGGDFLGGKGAGVNSDDLPELP